MAEIEIYSTLLCPFAHRSRLTLMEKGIAFREIEIDLQNKPANFLKISAYGKVPVLKHGDEYLWESNIINEYLDEVFPEPPLLPQEPIQRARARIWINFADTKLFGITGKLLHGCDLQKSAALLKSLSNCLLFIEREGLQKASDNGSYWFGSEISLVDFTYYPWFEQLSVLEHFLGFQLPAGLDRLQQWWEAVASRESVRAIAKDRDFYIESYGKLARSQPG